MNESHHRVPTRIRDMAAETSFSADGESRWVNAKLCCARCRRSELTLLVRYETVHIGSDAGKALPFDPVWVACTACRYYALLFDSECDGYNGVINKGPLPVPDRGLGAATAKRFGPMGAKSPPFEVRPWDGAEPGAYLVEVEYKYSEHVTEGFGEDEPVQDAYEWFTVFAKNRDGATLFELEFETA